MSKRLGARVDRLDRFVRTFLLLLSLASGAAAQTAEEPLELDVIGERPHPHQPSSEDALAASVIRRDRLEAPGLTAAEALRTESGVAVVQYGGYGSVATASIRGATAAQTPVYLGGIRLNDEVAGAADLSVVPLWLIQRVEIYRGNAPLSADEFGIGGAILFEPIRPRRNGLGTGASAGSFGTAGLYTYVAAANERQATLVGASFSRAANDYPFLDNRGTLFVTSDDVESRQQNIDVSLLDFWTISAFDLSGGARIDVLGNLVLREQGVPRLALLPTEKTRANYARLLVGARARTPFGPQRQHELDLATSFTNADSTYDDPDLEVLLVPRMEVSGRRAAQRALARFELLPALRLDTVIDASVDQLLRRDGDAELRADARSGRAALGLSFEPWTGFFLLPILGLGCRSAIEGAGLCEQSEPVGRAAVAWRSRSLYAFAGVGRYVRFPTLSEVHGGGVLVRGNQNLEPEQGVTADLGARWQHGLGPLFFWTDAAAYARLADDLISYARSQAGLVPINVQSARILGLESSAGIDYVEAVGGGVDVGLTFTDPRDVTPGRTAENDILPFQSRFRAAAGVSGRIKYSRARLSMFHQASRYGDPAGLIVIPQQTSFDLEFEQGFGFDTVRVRARLKNISDAPQFDVVGYPLPGRSVFVAMDGKL